MPEAFRAWKDLEADAGATLYIRTGGVSFSPPGVDYVARVAENLAALEVPHWRTSGGVWNRRHPVFQLPDAYDVVFEADAGLVAAGRAVALQVELARRHGGDRTQVIENSPVRRIDLDGSSPIVVTDSSRIVAERLIVSAGAWVKRLLPALPVPLRATRQQVLYFRPNDRSSFQIGSFPVFIYKGAGEEEAFYGMPEFQTMAVKVARHAGPEVDPDVEDRIVQEDY
jgi:sarcosine oxidase